MADINAKPKLQLRPTGATINGDKSPSPATKLLLNHGKPNFTIQRSPKAENGEGNPLSATLKSNSNNNYYAYKTANNNDIVLKSTKFNGVFNPASVPIANNQSQDENEVTKVVLRRTKLPDPTLKEEEEDASVPEFIRRQRQIQERLAKENILDFESRRSGYFTHCMITPTSPNRTSFVETMASPAVVPSLEIPPPTTEEENQVEPAEQQIVTAVATTNGNSNGHADEEEEVTKAIEEVNKAIAGEDDDKPAGEEEVEPTIEAPVVAAVSTLEHIEEPITTTTTATAETEVESKHEIKEEEVAVTTPLEHTEENIPPENVIAATIVTTSAVIESPQQNGHHVDDETNENGNAVEVATTQNGHEVTISHTNGNGPHIPSPDPSGVLGVNYEPKTVVSFSKDLGSEPNKYPDTVKVVKEGEPSTPSDENLKDLAKLKFDIKTDDQDDVQVTPVLRAE